MTSLGLRKQLAIHIGRSPWLPDRYYWSMEVIRDLAEKDPDAFHRFLWANHLAYAETYEPEHRFGDANLHPSRRLLFQELEGAMERCGMETGEVTSVLEVGCSLGYLLRHMETSLFPGATVLDGVDIDASAVDAGGRRLRAEGSRVRLVAGDMAELEQRLGSRIYDLVFCAGTLMYLQERAAASVVAAMLARTRKLLVLAGLADGARDNRHLECSSIRQRDGTFIHNLDAMVVAAGGDVLARRWDGSRSVGGNTIYFVFAQPPGRAALRQQAHGAVPGTRRP